MRTKLLFSVGLLVVLIGGCARNAEMSYADRHVRDGLLAETDHNDRDAAEHYRRALHDQPKHVDALFALATLETRQEKFDAASRTWERLVAATDQSAGALNNLGYCYDLWGNPRAAEANYRKAIDADPNCTLARINYGIMLARHERFNEAICQLQLAMPASEAWYNLALIQDRQGHSTMARDSFARSYSLAMDETADANTSAMYDECTDAQSSLEMGEAP